MTQGRGVRAGEYRAPLFLAWQLTNSCRGNCLHCCEDSGPGKAWPRELTRRECLDVAAEAAALGVAKVAFGGGEPLAAPHFWEVLETLRRGGVEVKIETDGAAVDAAAAGRMAGLGVGVAQISLDGAAAAGHDALRPGSPFDKAEAAVSALSAAGVETEAVYSPTRLNIAEGPAVYDLAGRLGASRFVSGPLMRLGRAAAAWEDLAPAAGQWESLAAEVAERSRGRRCAAALYPSDILGELRLRLEAPQAMLLVVPDGKVKLLNALPFACADLRRDSLEAAWAACVRAWSRPEVRAFAEACLKDPSLLRHANETWPL